MESHEYADLFPMLGEAELSELADSIKSNGLREPVVLLGGKVLDGRNRLRACGIAGVEPRFAELPDGQDPLQFVLDHNLHRRHLNESQRAMVGERLKVIYAAEAQQRMLAGKGDDGSGGRGNKKNPPKDFTEGFKGDSRDKAAAAVNVSGPLIDAAAKVRGPNAIPELAAAVVAGDIAVTRAAKIAALPQEQQREAVAKPHVSHNSGENEWYTPPQYIVAAREVMGEIDLDPASSEVAQKVVQAERFYTKDDDGLHHEWSGRVWMNPPYSNVTPWWDKFSSHRNGIALLPMAKSHWVNRVFDEAEGIAIGEDGGEMKFMRPGQKPMRIWFPVFFAAFGDECVEAIGRIGRVRR